MKQLIISSSFTFDKIAILENGLLEEFFYEKKYEQDSYVGNIYLGRVEDILPGMQAAFINIGLEKNAYLYIDELLSSRILNEKSLIKEKVTCISEVIKKGEELLVQVIRDPIGEKNLTLTTDISLAGKCVAVIPGNNEVNVSKRINNKSEKKSLYKFGKSIQKENYGMILRTFSKNVSEEVLKKEYNNLIEECNSIIKKSKYTIAPKIIKQSSTLIENVFIDYINNNIDEIYVENDDDEKLVRAYLKKYEVYNSNIIKLIKKNDNLFELFKIEKQIRALNERKIDLENGGSIVIDTTEAMTVIDVNSGSYIGKTEQDETSLVINIDAMKEIARQLKLRNIGGIIIIDFIDFRHKDYSNKLIEKAKEFLKNDKVKTKVLGMTKLNLMEMTRKRNKDNFYSFMNEECSDCKGNGKLPSSFQILLRVENIIKKIKMHTSSDLVVLKCSSHIHKKMMNMKNKELKMLEDVSGVQVRLIEDKNTDGNMLEIDKMSKKASI